MTAGAIEVAAGVLIREGRLLLARRPLGGHLGGLWEFPGGKREPGEEWEHCVLREFMEELGVEIAAGVCLERVVHNYPERCVELRFFRCRLLRGEPEPLGCAALAWVGRSALMDYAYPEADMPLVRRLSAEASLWQDA